MADDVPNEAENDEQLQAVITRGPLESKTKASAEGGLAGMKCSATNRVNVLRRIHRRFEQ
jgi:hypothetical protein